ncbi:MAG: FIST C-terminal domain-containing protein [Vallitaleaceae bacterium]|jgi:hypothetical protein|nr:FIST C-terminal domain-containing protein [Vallitaleaceae bacterium]
MTNIITSFSSKRTHEEAVTEIEAQLSLIKPNLVIFFASSFYKPDSLALRMQQAFPSATTLGCTTSGEICNNNVLAQSIVAIGFTKEAIGDYHVRINEHMSTANNIDAIFESYHENFDESPLDMNPKKYFGLVLFDGLSNKEESFMSHIGALTNINFIGGTAGDDQKFIQTHIFHNGKAYLDATLLMLCKPGIPFDFIKTQSFDILEQSLTCTKVDPSTRTVIEFNNKPASIAYADLLGVQVHRLADYFIKYPIGMVTEDELFVRSPLTITGTSIKFHCNILENITYQLLKSKSVIADTKIAIAEKSMTFGHISAMINFNCRLRTVELINSNSLEDYGRIFENIPTIGFNTYGEAFIGHMNQTSTILIFGSI